MSELISQMFTPPVIAAIAICIIIIILLYLLCILWVFTDARRRDTPALLWTLIAIVPVAGLVAYCLLRPPLTTEDQDEQDMQLDLLQRQLEQYGECPSCKRPVERDFVICPNCHRQLRNVCMRCGRTLDPAWDVCPYCTTPVGPASK